MNGRKPKNSLRVIVTGLVAQHRFLGGVAWDYLNVVLGLKNLGHDVYYFEDSGQWPYNLEGGSAKADWIDNDHLPTVGFLSNVMSAFGLSDKWAYRFPIKPKWFGLTGLKRREVLATADLLINVSGTLHRPEDYRMIPRLAYIDTDPVFTQIRFVLPRGQKKFRRRINAHDVFFTVGERIHASAPDTQHQWHATKHPIALSEWKSSSQTRNVLTTVMNWTSYKPVTFRGRSFGQKDTEFMKFLRLPEEVRAVPLELAISKTAHADWQNKEDSPLGDVSGQSGNDTASWPLERGLSRYGWQVVDSVAVCPDYDTYRKYIQTSLGEWSVAKNGYVCTKSGWFSGRSACYLAAGKPVVVQNTGFDEVLPTGAGVLAFETMDEAKAGVEDVMRRYKWHARAARDIAAEYFDSGKVLNRILEIALNSKSAAVNSMGRAE